jgi:hypothetical protein
MHLVNAFANEPIHGFSDMYTRAALHRDSFDRNNQHIWGRIQIALFPAHDEKIEGIIAENPGCAVNESVTVKVNSALAYIILGFCNTLTLSIPAKVFSLESLVCRDPL